VELREAMIELDVSILYVMADNQINNKTRRFVDEAGLRDKVRFLADPGGAAIAELGIGKQDPEPMEAGVPHPATYVLDRRGQIRFIDVREDFHIWLDPQLTLDALAAIP
jgi:peroxiredoxin